MIMTTTLVDGKLIMRPSTPSEIEWDEDMIFYKSDPITDQMISIEDKYLHEKPIADILLDSLYSDITGLDNIIIWIVNGIYDKPFEELIKIVRPPEYSTRDTKSLTIPLIGHIRKIGNLEITTNEWINLLKWVELNREYLLEYTNNHEMCFDELIKKIIKV